MNGLDGIERNHADHSEMDRERVDQYANEYALFQTGGSDFHGDYGKLYELGDELSPTESSLKDIFFKKGTQKTMVRRRNQ